MAAPDNAHAKLDAILDEEEEGAGMQVDAAGDEAALYGAFHQTTARLRGRLSLKPKKQAHNLPPPLKPNPNPHKTAAHVARTRAEDAAADAIARLVVAQVQLAEYAEERAAAAASAAADARKALEAAGGGGGDGAASGNPALAALCTSLEEAAEEAAAFATQQRADAERLKASAEAGAAAGGGGAGTAAGGAAGEAASAGGEDGGSKRRGTAGAKRRSGGAGGSGADASKRRGSANGRSAAAAGAAGADGTNAKDDDSSSIIHSARSDPTTTSGGSTTASSSSSEDLDDDGAEEDDDDGPANGNGSGAFRRGDLARAQRALAAAADPQDAAVSIRDRARHIPLRLKLEDRRLLRLLEAALQVSEYVDRVDVLTWRSRASRANAQVKDLCAILSGLVVAQDYKAGQRLVQDRDFAANAEFFQDVSFFWFLVARFLSRRARRPTPLNPPAPARPSPQKTPQQQTKIFEIGRRYKIMNPDKMRDTFGKLVYMLMDAQTPEVQELLEFPLVRPLRTVWSFLEERAGAQLATALLDDPLCPLATAEIPSGNGRSRAEVQRDIRAKERARETLARRYARPPNLTQDDVLWCLYSIADNNSFLLFNRDPIDRLLRYFYAAFPQGQPPVSAEFSLAISAGKNGARLTHSHARQWGFVQQSLTLWREIMHDMFRLYSLAERDMIGGSNYRLCDTGQGLNRLQGAPNVARAMNGIVGRVQQRCGGWIGSAYVHLGDANVPNALFFLDKYMQVPRILNPVVNVLDAIPSMCAKDEGIREYVRANFGSVEGAQKTILTDFCRHAFDGSGADNSFAAGSCIDGRLTAAWQFTSVLGSKRYAPLFRLAGWSGFDGSFRE
jgi:hypothetical protein